EMISQLKEQFGKRVAYVTTTESVNAPSAKNGKATGRINTMGVNADYMKANKVDLLTGRSINEQDEEAGKKVCVISDTLAKSLYGGADPIGKTLDLDISGSTHTFYVVGVYESTNLYIPISTAKRINNANTNFANITVVAGVGEGSDALAQDLNHFFDRQYKNNPRFYAQGYSMQSMVESTTKTFKTISMAISVIAGISLLVGGIGVMNIMLVSITERTREIGTRKALGATNGSIRFQFIVESVIICLVGGTIGIILGVGLGTIGSKLVGYAARPSFTSIFIAVGFSMAIGIFFGYYPANKAAKLDPIEALRYE
ncbi:MAG: FtsX-like permease family protein, partial [Oscillospiraceae bacterium]